MSAVDTADAVLLVSAARTPIGRLNGALRDVDAVELGATAIRGALDRLPVAVTPQHAFLANVVQAGNGQNPARVAAVRAGLPLTVPATTLNDVCPASMSAVGLAAAMIELGRLDCALVGGFESMSRAPHGVRMRGRRALGDADLIDLLLTDGLTCSLTGRGMGELSDEVNADLGIGRDEQDAFAAESHRRADRARRDGTLAREIVPCADVTADEGIRPATTPEILAGLRPAFAADGTITAGNASQLSDAAAAGILTSRRYASEHGLQPLVAVVGWRAIAGPDASLHSKPAAAARQLLDAYGLAPRDIDLWEINEAFAGVVLAAVRDLGIDLDVVNVNGGAIALGHPLAASGFRLVQTLAEAMVAGERPFGVATMCGGGGQGQAILLRLIHP
ncbi:acetyl-CoA C-acyltransferase [Dactylosporangium sp. NPDC051485]|uniref:thiolase family protein n=1 Tax=Dactylosporangium sp. NPDC051485 TaxID=3154846 RepID=UPI00342D5394